MVDVTVEVDLNDPPKDPPAGCVDPLLWRLAREKFEAHRLTAAGFCGTCPSWKRCPGTALAKDGLATALGQTVKESAYWIAFAQIMAHVCNDGSGVLGVAAVRRLV